MVVDDEPRICQFFEQTLGEEGYKVVATTSGRKALALALEVHPDLILLDIMMPDLDGIATLRELRKDGYGGAVVIVTGRGSLQTAREAMVLGAYEYITKPFNLEFLKSVVWKGIDDGIKRSKETSCVH
jgi:DNA-binding response OmpR family regulator